jgi:hypothetical protein
MRTSWPSLHHQREWQMGLRHRRVSQADAEAAIISPMPKRSGRSKKTQVRKVRDENQIAPAVIEKLEQIAEDNPGKDPIAVLLGRRGGLKGGRARMDRLSPEERRKLGLKGAKARWGRRQSD